MSVKELLIQAPHLCGASNAKKHAEVARIVWDHEQEKKGFKREDDESAEDRISFLFDWISQDEDKQDYCMNLAHLNVLAHYAREHADVDAQVEADDLKAYLEPQEALYPDVAKVLTVESAYTGWWGQ